MSPDTTPDKGRHETADAKRVQRIAPAELAHAGKGPGKPLPRRKAAFLVAVGAMLVLVLAVGTLLLRRPSGQPPPPTRTMPATKPDLRKATPPAAAAAPRAPSGPSSPVPAGPAPGRGRREAADRQLGEFLKAHQRLKGLGAAQWGNGGYRGIMQLADRGDMQYRDGNFAAAAAVYGRAALQAARLADGAPAALKKLLARSLADIEAGNGQMARQKLQVARQIDPRNRQVKKLLQRAAQAEKVQQLFLNGQRLEKNGAAERALAQYRQALKLDGDASRVRKAYHDLRVLVADAKYRRCMSAGLAAFERKAYRRARASLLQARALKPGAAEVQDALSQVNAALQKQRMDVLRERAKSAEAAANWGLALQSYQAVLAMDDKVAFAVDGKQRVEAQIRRLKRLDFFLKDPRVLQDDRRLGQARQLLREMQAAAVLGPRTGRDIRQLERLVTLYATPVPVTIVSDGLTRVAVYRVGRLGRFKVYRLKLRPGSYTIVGSRDGYQDVQQKLVVKPGLGPFQIRIACKTRV